LAYWGSCGRFVAWQGSPGGRPCVLFLAARGLERAWRGGGPELMGNPKWPKNSAGTDADDTIRLYPVPLRAAVRRSPNAVCRPRSGADLKPCRPRSRNPEKSGIVSLSCDETTTYNERERTHVHYHGMPSRATEPSQVVCCQCLTTQPAGSARVAKNQKAGKISHFDRPARQPLDATRCQTTRSENRKHSPTPKPCRRTRKVGNIQPQSTIHSPLPTVPCGQHRGTDLRQ